MKEFQSALAATLLAILSKSVPGSVTARPLMLKLSVLVHQPANEPLKVKVGIRN